MLDRLVLADRPAEDDAILGVLRCPLDGGAAEADRLGGNQNALRIHAVQDVVEALAFLADAVLDRHRRPSMNNLLESTALRPILSISRTST